MRPKRAHPGLTKARGSVASIGKLHPLEKRQPARVIVEFAHEGIHLHIGDAGVALRVGAFQPLEGLLRIVAGPVGLGNLIGAILSLLLDQLRQHGIGFGDVATRVLYCDDSHRPEYFVHLALHGGQRLVEAPLVRTDEGEPAIGEPALRAQLQRLVQRRLRLLQRARGKTVEPDIPVLSDVERVELDGPPKQRHSLVEAAEVARESCRAVHRQRAPGGEFQRSTE